MDAVGPEVHVVHVRQVPFGERASLGLPGLGELGDRRGRQALGRCRGTARARARNPRWTARAGTAAATPRRSSASCVPTAAGSPSENRCRSPVSASTRLSLTRGAVTCDRAGAGEHLARLVAAVAHHQPMPALVALVGELGDIGVDFGLQRLGQHPPRTLPDDLVDQRRRPGRRRGGRTLTLGRIRNYGEHRDVPSRPALHRRSSLEPSIGHPGRYAPSRADPQISSIAPETCEGAVRRLIRETVTRSLAATDEWPIRVDVVTSQRSDDGHTKRWFVEYETGPYGEISAPPDQAE